MMDIVAFKSKCGVTKNKYVEDWLKEDLIPGTRSGPSLEDVRFPDSARRPYRYRARIKPTADATNIRAHIVNACIRREHISAKMCYLTQKEFDAMIESLVTCGIISLREEDGVTYYDSTTKSDSYSGKCVQVIRKFVLDALTAMSRGITEAGLSTMQECKYATLV